MSIQRRLVFKLSAMIVLIDFIALLIASIMAAMLIVIISDDPTEAFSYNVIYYTILSILLIIGCTTKGHYTHRVPWWSQMQVVIKLIGSLFVLDALIHLATQETYVLIHSLFYWLSAAILVPLARLVSIYIISKNPDWKLPIALIGNPEIITDSFFAFYADGFTGYEVKTVLVQGRDAHKLDLNFLPDAHPPVEIIDIKDHFDSFIRNNPQYFYVISLEEFRGERRDRLMNALEETGREYAIIPSMKRLHLHGMEPHYFFGNDIMLLHKRHVMISSVGRISKRTLDIIASGCALPFLLLLTAIVWVLKRLDGSTTPLFYGGARVGLDDREFPCWKFCTMKANADKYLYELLESDPAAKEEWEKYKKLKNDPRIDSRISALLRKTSLDELPQLWNVFRGDMSLVGPRPILPEQRADYGEQLKHYILFRPGLTGLWQVSGRNEISFEQRIVWDCWYIRNWSFWHDVVILIKTVRVFLTGSGAY